MKKVIISSVVISALVMPQGLFAADLSGMTCSYAANYNTCVEANQNGTARSIDDFICMESRGGGEEMLLQIILDEKFQEIDKQAEKYLERLEESKDYYFGAEPQEHFLAAIDDINTNFAQYEYYWKQYHNVCTKEVLSEFLSCTDSIVNTNAPDFLSGIDTGICISMMETKLQVYKQVAYDTLKLNRLAIREDDRKEYVIEQRGKYGGVMQLMLDILGYMERVANGWVTKTKNPYGG